jgi:5'-nucleotidase/UDP-sugar diphosphatase
MKIIINNITLELFNGARVRDAILGYYAEIGEECPDPMPAVEDKYGNMVESDGELNDGNVIFIKEKKNKNFSLLFLALAILTSGLLLACSTGGKAVSGKTGEKQAVIFAVNDMHAAIDNFPRLAYIVDSLRAVYPSMILVSAGDNQTGNPVNDQYPEKGLPMIELMNALKFDMSAVGNHEFDTHQKGFSYLTHKADFPFLCANVTAKDSLKIKIKPYEIIKLKNGLRIAFLGLLQINDNGIPDTHPDNTKGFVFQSAFETALKYMWLKDKSDIFIALTHLGFESDIKLAETMPRGIDLIIGGHSHTVIAREQVSNGILITQAGSKLKYGTLITLNRKEDGTLQKTMELVGINKSGKELPAIRAMVDRFNDNPRLKEQIAIATDDFSSKEELGYLMADAQRAEANADMAFVNPGGVRISHLAKGPVTVMDIYELDQFGNALVLTKLSGHEIMSLINSACKMDNNHPPYSSGIKIDLKRDKDGKPEEIYLLNEDGKPLDLNKTYSVAMNDYMIQVYKYKHDDPGKSLFITTAEATINYLKKNQKIPGYRKVKRIQVD